MFSSRATRGHAAKLSASVLLSLLLAAQIPSVFALDTFKTFAGSDFIDVPSSPELQLEEFTIEVRFRILQDPTERGYLVSKSSVANGSLLLDQNYAIFITPLNKIGGGFRALDGTYNYVYSPPVSTDAWHVARLMYGAGTLRLSIDGTSVAAKSVDKIADTLAEGDLRIGANANGQADKFFVGDMDYVKIVDRSTFVRVYFNDFKDDTDPGPAPVSDCADVPMSELRGAVFKDPILSRFETEKGPSAPADYVEESMRYIKANDMNLVRVPFYWEAYESWPAAFMSELELIAQAADAYDICVIFDNHHWYTSSYFADVDIGKTGTPRGFPSFVMQGYPTTGDYASAAGPFWKDFLSNNIEIEGKKIWDAQADFFAMIIEKVDGYDSVAGYEIMNEPQLFNVSQYDDLGNYHTYMAGKIRDMTDKKIVFNRETTRGFLRETEFEYKIVPQGVSGLVYGPHLYAVPADGSPGAQQIKRFGEWSREWNVEVMIGEWSADSQEEMDTFVFAFRDAGFAWTYQKWASSENSKADNLGNVIYDSDSSPPTIFLEYLANAIDAAY